MTNLIQHWSHCANESNKTKKSLKKGIYQKKSCDKKVGGKCVAPTETEIKWELELRRRIVKSTPYTIWPLKHDDDCKDEVNGVDDGDGNDDDDADDGDDFSYFQIPRNLSLPGGFKLGGFGNEYCDVITATGRNICFISALYLFQIFDLVCDVITATGRNIINNIFVSYCFCICFNVSQTDNNHTPWKAILNKMNIAKHPVDYRL